MEQYTNYAGLLTNLPTVEEVLDDPSQVGAEIGLPFVRLNDENADQVDRHEHRQKRSE